MVPNQGTPKHYKDSEIVSNYIARSTIENIY